MARIEIYSKEWCPYCSKAKSLLRAKGLEYREIDITHDETLEQEMLERSHRQTVPQIFIDSQSVGGYDDLSQLNASGELNRLLGIESGTAMRKVYDLAIVGAGPAGMSASLYAARKNLSCIVISMDVGGQMGITNEIANYPGIASITGPDLVNQFEEHADAYGIEKLIGEKITDIEIRGRCKVLSTASGQEIHARSVIMASGASKRKLDIPGEKEFAGKGVVYCSTCDGPLFRDKTIAVVGSGNSALEAAVEMSGIAEKVYLVSRGDWSGDLILHDKVTSTDVVVYKGHDPMEIQGNGKVQGLVLKDRETGEHTHLSVDGVFIEIGLSPNSDFTLDLLETNDRGEIRVNRELDTGVRGIFAAGDVTDGPDKQVIVAAGEGARAALAAFTYLLHQA